MPIISKPLPLRRAERKNGSRIHSADPPRTPASAPPPHRHSGNTQHENTETQKSAPLSGDRSATAPHNWKRTLKPKNPLRQAATTPLPLCISGNVPYVFNIDQFQFKSATKQNIRSYIPTP